MKTIYDREETPKAGYLYTRSESPLYYEKFRVSRELYRILAETVKMDDADFETDDFQLVGRSNFKIR